MRLKIWHLDDHSHCCHLDEALSLECDCLVCPSMLPALRLCFCRAPTSTLAFVSKAFLWDFPSLACQSASCPRPRSPLHSEGCLDVSIRWLLGSQVLPISDPKYFEQWHLSWACTDFSCHCFQTVMSFLKHLQCFRDDLRTWKAVHSVCKYYAIVSWRIWAAADLGTLHVWILTTHQDFSSRGFPRQPCAFLMTWFLCPVGGICSARVFCAGCCLYRIVWTLCTSHRSQTAAWGH